VPALAVMLAFFSGPSLAARKEAFKSPEAALEYAVKAMQARHYDRALPALELAAGKGLFLAEFYLARMFSDNLGPNVDHAKAYMLYQRIADENADIDPDYDQRAPFVAKAFTALAGYLRQGLPEIGLRPNSYRAAEYLHHAATFFNDVDAQFELAKFYLNSEGKDDAKQAMHWLSVLTEKGHAGAQAFLADLYWRGQHVPQDRKRALALITMALEHAPAHERIWIEDIHQNIFCGATEGTRKDADSLVENWRRHYRGQPTISIDRHGLAPLQLGPVRTCSDGEPVQASRTPPKAGISTSALRTQEPPAMMQGNTLGFGLRDAGETRPAEDK
jgi:TPR repeat protein